MRRPGQTGSAPRVEPSSASYARQAVRQLVGVAHFLPVIGARLSVWPRLELPAAGSLRLRDRIFLAAEIMAAYLPLARLVRTNDVEAMVKVARSRDRSTSSVPAPEAQATAVRLGMIVERVLTLLPTDNRCLIRSLVVLRLLGRRGIPASLVIGVRAGGRFGAHAWVEHNGCPVLPAAEFVRLVEL